MKMGRSAATDTGPGTEEKAMLSTTQAPGEPTTAARKPRCPRCGSDELVASDQVFADGTRHIRGNCAQCNAFVRYLPQPESGAKPRLYFGKHAGQTLDRIPSDYLAWCAATLDKLPVRLRNAIRQELERRQESISDADLTTGRAI
jgi:hypothetical protein